MTFVRGRILSCVGLVIGTLALVGAGPLPTILAEQVATDAAVDASVALDPMILSSWESDAPVVRETAPTETEAALAARVAALEKTLAGIQTAAAVEPLPVGGGTSDTCKELEIITKPAFTPTGRIYFDGVAYDDDPSVKEYFDADRENEVGLRQFRLGGRGYLWENLYYNVEVELRGGPNSIAYKDIFMEQQNLPRLGHFRAGHFKEPLGLEEDGSDLFLTFMEKSPATQAFTPARNFGVMVWNTVDPCWDTTWFAGVFATDSSESPGTNTGTWRTDANDWAYDARLATLPYYDEPSKGRYLVHLGGSYSFRHIGDLSTGAAGNQNVAYSNLNGLAEFTTRSWIGSQGPIAFGAEADSNQWNQLNAEFLVIWGAASVQSEYFQVLMNGGETYQGAYGFFSYMLTGENRSYRKETKTIDRTIPYEPFFMVDTCNGRECGWGAWEVAMGFSWVDLTDGHDTVVTDPPNSSERLRGTNSVVIVGINWYQNPWSRVAIDYELEMTDYLDRGVPNSNAGIFGTRWQVDW